MDHNAYRQFCHENPRLPLHAQPWYLDSACNDGEWGAVTVEENGQIVAAMPWFLKKKGPFRYIGMPVFIKYMGPYFRQTEKPMRLTEIHQLYDSLIAQLPAVHSFVQDFHPSVTNWLPFYWKGYQQTTRYTYHLQLDDLDRVYEGFNRNIQRNIRKARDLVSVSGDGTLQDLHRLCQLSFDRQGLAMPYSFDLLEKHGKALEANRAMRLFFAKDADGRLHSAACLTFDACTAYYHIAGDDPEVRNSGAGILLVSEAIRYTKEVLGLGHFDFEGSMLPQIEAIRRNFGATQQPYFRVWKTSSRLYGWSKQLAAWLR